jgi:hypothetical protein
MRAMRRAAEGWIMDTKREGKTSFDTLARAMQAAAVHISPCQRANANPKILCFSLHI